MMAKVPRPLPFILFVSTIVYVIYFYPLVRNFLALGIDYSALWASFCAVGFVFVSIGARRWSKAKNSLLDFSDYSLGFAIYYFLAVLASDIILIVNMLVMQSSFVHAQSTQMVALAMTIAVFVFSVVNYHRAIRVSYVEITSPHVTRPYAVLHITDTQYGTLGDRDIRKIAHSARQTIAQHKIDLVLFTGDLVDKDIHEVGVLRELDFGLPQYFSLGNHEFIHNTESILRVIHDINYTILREEAVNFSDLRIIGIDDSARKQQVKETLAQHELMQDGACNILMYHRPTGVEDARMAGVELMLTGHTHGGQFFPFNLVVRAIFDVRQGLTRLDGLTIYASDGAGLWGPKMRLGSRNEITVIEITPQE